MRVEAASAQGGMARQAIALGVTRDTALEVLARGWPVAEEKTLLRIVISAAKRSPRSESRLLVAVGAECTCVVALGTRGFAPVRRRRMARKEARRVVSRSRSCVRPMAGETVRPSMAHRAALGGCRRDRPMPVREVVTVGCGPVPLDRCAWAAPGPGGVHGQRGFRLPHVAGDTAFTGVTDRAALRRAARHLAVLLQEVCDAVAGGGLELGLDGQGPRIGREGLDRRHLRGVHMAAGAEVTGVAGGAAGGHPDRRAVPGLGRLGELAVLLDERVSAQFSSMFIPTGFVDITCRRRR